MNDMGCADNAARVDEMKTEFRGLIRDTDCNSCLQRDNCDQRYNIKLDYILTGWELAEWIDLTQDRGDWRCCGCNNDRSECYSGPFSMVSVIQVRNSCISV